jgi:type III secretion protein D
VWTPSLLLAALRDGGEPFPALQLDRGPEARLQLRGSLADEAQRAPLKARLAALLPAGWPIDDSALLGPAQLGEAFIARARAAGFALSGSATPGQPPQLQLQGRIEPEQLARWEQWLVAENHRLAGSLRFTVALQPAPPLAPMSLREPRLPFALRAVIGGPEPQLLLVDGRRLLPGGELDGLRLLAIEPELLRFERLRTREVFSLPR